MSQQLPAAFADLAQFVPGWNYATEQARSAFRVQQSQPVLEDFYHTVMARLDEIAAYLDAFALDALTRDQGNLLELALMVMEVAPAIEYYHLPDVPHAVAFEKFDVLPTPPRYRVVDP